MNLTMDKKSHAQISTVESERLQGLYMIDYVWCILWYRNVADEINTDLATEASPVCNVFLTMGLLPDT